MKRFHSNLQKVFDISEQQRRMAELELTRAVSLQRAAELEVVYARRQMEKVRLEVNQALLVSRQSTVMIGMYQHISASQEAVQKLQQAATQAAQVCDLARTKYQTLHSQVERIESLIQKQREMYRREMLLNQQHAMDDVSILRWTQPEQSETEVISHG